LFHVGYCPASGNPLLSAHYHAAVGNGDRRAAKRKQSSWPVNRSYLRNEREPRV